MNYLKKLTALLSVLSIMHIACASTPSFSDVADRDWSLTGVRINSKSIDFNRGQLAEEGFGEIFTLRFDAERINGVAAPNRYFGPYTQGNKQSLTIKQVATTQMAALREPEKLKERDYLLYLQNTVKWNLKQDNLELYSKGEDGKEVILIFSQAGK
jgi:heat shock protein HslJ